MAPTTTVMIDDLMCCRAPRKLPLSLIGQVKSTVKIIAFRYEHRREEKKFMENISLLKWNLRCGGTEKKMIDWPEDVATRLCKRATQTTIGGDSEDDINGKRFEMFIHFDIRKRQHARAG